MWFKIDSDLIHRSIPFYRCTSSLFRGDRTQSIRFWILIEILAESANDRYWVDVEHLTKTLRLPKKCCEQVWNICIEEKVLRPINDGFSASEWMREIGILGNIRTEKERRSCEPSRSKEQPAKNDFMSIDITSPFKS